MSVFSCSSFDAHEEVVFCQDEATGLKAIIAIHDTRLGPALGGCRFWPYDNEEQAISDALRLSRGMTYKAAMADTGQGGGKTVIIGDPRQMASPALFQTLGRAVERLDGRYIIAEDVGTTMADMAEVRRETRHVSGLEGGSGDPSPATALGVYTGIRAGLKHRFGSSEIRDARIAIQGLGHVGWDLAERLYDAGAQLIVADMRDELSTRAVRRLGATAVGVDTIHRVECEVFSPCALGAVINDNTLPQLKADIIAGSANNQLADVAHGDALAERGILYAPDYVINAGGIINIAHEQGGYDQVAAFSQVAEIGEVLQDLFIRADAESTAPHRMADQMAQEIIANGPVKAKSARIAA